MNNAVNTNLKEGTDVLTGIAIVAFESLCCLTIFQKLFFVVFNFRYDAWETSLFDTKLWTNFFPNVEVKKNIIISIIIIIYLFIYFATHIFLTLVKDYNTCVTVRSSQLCILANWKPLPSGRGADSGMITGSPSSVWEFNHVWSVIA